MEIIFMLLTLLNRLPKKEEVSEFNRNICFFIITIWKSKTVELTEFGFISFSIFPLTSKLKMATIIIIGMINTGSSIECNRAQI